MFEYTLSIAAQVVLIPFNSLENWKARKNAHGQQADVEEGGNKHQQWCRCLFDRLQGAQEAVGPCFSCFNALCQCCIHALTQDSDFEHMCASAPAIEPTRSTKEM
eukprot:TRINITY_DN20922_c0_g3_i1.p1 TRINITY_DN20922_c0_g3~~TRINITY_DN20922_c0_g3_i1.p1  ORF type:complete len:105 (+),score=11.95 TRINITY_DN20922_c0_g3_i1:202-516(+)